MSSISRRVVGSLGIYSVFRDFSYAPRQAGHVPVDVAALKAWADLFELTGGDTRLKRVAIAISEGVPHLLRIRDPED